MYLRLFLYDFGSMSTYQHFSQTLRNMESLVHWVRSYFILFLIFEGKKKKKKKRPSLQDLRTRQIASLLLF